MKDKKAYASLFVVAIAGLSSAYPINVRCRRSGVSCGVDIRKTLLVSEKNLLGHSGNDKDIKTTLHMSSVGDERDKESGLKNEFKLPPFPENNIVLGGDVGALFFYSFLDHFLNFLYTSILKVPSGDEIVGMNAAWLDVMHMPAAFISNQLPVKLTYAPLLDSAGICSVLIATCWLVSGYFNEAFSYKNTVCETPHAMKVAGRTWIFAAAAMVALAWWSDAVGSPLQDQVGGLTQTDADYIFDSLAVVVVWRWVFSYMMGKW